MRILHRFKELPFADLSFFLLFSYLFYALFRFIEPVPTSLFYPGFGFQFGVGFFSQLYQRKFGRILTAICCLTLVRLPFLSGIPVSNSMQIYGVLFGSILGIWMREFALIILGRNEVPLPKQSDQILVDWMIRNPTKKSIRPIWQETSFGFLFFLLFLILLSFFGTQGFGFFKGLYFQEYLYLPGLSSREAFGFSARLLLNIALVFLYFFSEERSMPTPSKESLIEHLQFGVFLGFFIQILFLSAQSVWDLRFFSGNTFDSLKVGRAMGLFLDSGSSSWILPTLGALIGIHFLKTWKKTKERALLVFTGFLFLLITLLGQKQGKAFWVIWILFLFVSGILFFTYRLEGKIKWIVRFLLYLFLPLILYAICFGLSKIDSDLSLILLTKKIQNAIQMFFQTDFYTTLREFDQNRAELLKITWEGIVSSPWLGNGVSSFPISLLDATRAGTKQTEFFVDYPPNLYLTILHDVGIFGSLLVICFVGLFVWERASWIRLSLLILPFAFGLQIQHGDGAFVAIFLLFFANKGEIFYSQSFETIRKKIWFPTTLLVLSVGLSLNFLFFSLNRLLDEGSGPEFRFQKLKTYQSGATIPATPQNPFFEYHGKVWEWKLSERSTGREGSFQLLTTQKSDLVEVLFFNLQRIQLKQELLTETNQGYIYRGSAPRGTAFIRIRSYSKLEFRLNRSHLDAQNQFQF